VNRVLALAAAGTFGFASGAFLLACPSSADGSELRQPPVETRKADRYPQTRAPSSADCKYLIAGGGTAAAAALKTIVEEAVPANAGKTLLVTPRLLTEPLPPQETTASSIIGASFWGRLDFGNTGEAKDKSRPAVELVVGPSVESVNAVACTATLDTGEVIAYEKLLLATGGFVDEEALMRRICSRDAQPMVGYASTSADKLERLAATPRAVHADPPHVTVVGGSWAAASLAASIVERGIAVTMSHSEPAYLARHLPKYASQDVLRRFKFVADNAEVNVDTLAYSALNYVNCTPVPLQFRRGGLGAPADEFEATVHVSTVFDAYDIMQFRTDLVLFAPTSLPSASIVQNVPTDASGKLVAGPELSVYSDIYAAGACLSGESGNHLAAWSSDRATATGVHAARNMLGAREPFVDDVPTCFEVDLSPLCLKLALVGDVNGSEETFGFFLSSRDRDGASCGGELVAGVIFYVKSVRQDRVQVCGACVWDGLTGYGSRIDLKTASKRAVDVLKAHDTFGEMDVEDGVYDRRTVESMLQVVAREMLESSNETAVAQDEEERTYVEGGDASGAPSPAEDRSKMFACSPRERFVRRHKSARTVPLRDSELLFVGDKSLGAASGTSARERRDAAMHEIFRKAREH
jgi:Pyridine nucleotide-disulphide oxidoreductase